MVITNLERQVGSDASTEKQIDESSASSRDERARAWASAQAQTPLGSGGSRAGDCGWCCRFFRRGWFRRWSSGFGEAPWYHPSELVPLFPDQGSLDRARLQGNVSRSLAARMGDRSPRSDEAT